MERIEGLPSMATFIGQALHPTVRTCDTVGARLEQLRTQAAHTADLLRTRLTVEAQQQNIRELEQLQQNSRTQLLLQESRRGAVGRGDHLLLDRRTRVPRQRC